MILQIGFDIQIFWLEIILLVQIIDTTFNDPDLVFGNGGVGVGFYVSKGFYDVISGNDFAEDHVFPVEPASFCEHDVKLAAVGVWKINR